MVSSKILLTERIHATGLRHGVTAVLALAFAIQFFHLDARTLHGDELGSLVDASDLSRNLHALSYFFLLHLWIIGGTSEFWLRSLSALSIVVAVAAMFAATRRLTNSSVALMASALVATAPFAQIYAQQVRFYALFLLAACLVWWAFASYLTRPSRSHMLFLALANLFLLTTHVMSILLVLSEVIALFLFRTPFRRKQKMLALGTLTCAMILLLLLPGVRAYGFNILTAYVNDPTQYSVSRGLSIAQLAKIPLTFFFFTFGESVYPLKFELVISGSLAYGIALLLGFLRLRERPADLGFAGIATALSLVFLYLVFDALVPPRFEGAAPRYIIFLLPLFYFVAVVGVEGKKRFWLFIVLLSVNLGSLATYWTGDWAYTDDLIDWRAVTRWVDNRITPSTVLILDGRSASVANYYFPATWNQQSLWQYQSPSNMDELEKFSRIVFLTYDFRKDRRAQATIFLQSLENRCNLSDIWNQYPLFVYVCDRKTTGERLFQVEVSTGSVTIPVEVYGLEFADLRLPVSATLNGRFVRIRGAFSLPGLLGNPTQTLTLHQSTGARKLILFSNLTGENALQPGTTIANLKVKGEDYSTQTFALRSGYETSLWNEKCRTLTCRPVYTWRKRLALLGSERYPEAWQEFDASIFATELTLDRPMLVRSIELQRVTSTGVLYVWGIILEP